MNLLNKPLTDKQLRIIEAVFILAISIFPIFFNVPFRKHLDLPYEGAYRMYLGQMPFRDFKMPLGYGFLIIPWLSFKVFGPYLFTLIYAQVFINIAGAFALRGILKILNVSAVNIFFAILVYCIAYNFIFYRPWYNHTAFTFELIGLYFLLVALFKNQVLWKNLLSYFVSAFFIFFTFFTKQDYGGLAFLLAGAILLYISILEKKWQPIPIFFGFYFLIALIIILPLLPYGFGYWFNHGQPPHQSRVDLRKLLDEFFGGGSMLEKGYLVAIVIIIFNYFSDFKLFIQDKVKVVFTLLALGIVLEALITKVTSRLSSDSTTYFHAIGIAYILGNINFKANFAKLGVFVGTSLIIIIWCSSTYWQYASRFLVMILPPSPIVQDVNAPKLPEDKVDHGHAGWRQSSYRSLRKFTMPEQTIQGIDKIMQLPVVKIKNIRVLNLSELTMLAYEMPYTPEKNLPLWYHVGIGTFQPQLDEMCEKINKMEYDLVLFENIPGAPDFFPQQARKILKEKYKMTDSFMAPRRGEEDSSIEVFVK